MQKKNTHSQGFAVLPVLLIAITLALGATLVYVFMTNSPDKSTQNATNSTASEQDSKEQPKADSLKTASFGTAVKKNISVTYPKDWKYNVAEKARTSTTVDESNVEVVSPSGRFAIEVRVAIGPGLGGGCDTKDKSQVLKSFVYQKLPGAKATNFGTGKVQDIYYTEQLGTYTQIQPNVKDGYATIQLMTPGEFTRPYAEIKKGDSVCDLHLNEILILAPTEEKVVMFARLDIKGDVKDLTFKELQQLKEVQQAKAILKSIVIKK